MTIRDPDVRLLATIAASIKDDYLDPEESIWDGSPFAWIRARPSRQRGKIGEQLVAGWAAAKKLDVVTVHDAEADRIINGKRVEIKFSTLWASGGYKFQQLRDQNYDFVVCLGLSPLDAHCWVIPKAILWGTKRPDHVSGQHRGAAGTDTAWLAFQATDPPKWLKEYGGTLTRAYNVLRKLR